jgi:hypothetical protein
MNELCQRTNTTVRVLVLNEWYGSKHGSLLDRLPNLHRFEANIKEPANSLSNMNKPHTSLANVRVTLNGALNDLNKMLGFMPNLKKLRIRGKINENSVLDYFEKLTTIIRFRTPALQRFDCELYFYPWNLYDQVHIIVIQQLDPRFEKIQCILGKYIDQCYCYATDLTEYPSSSEYACKYKLIELSLYTIKR